MQDHALSLKSDQARSTARDARSIRRRLRPKGRAERGSCEMRQHAVQPPSHLSHLKTSPTSCARIGRRRRPARTLRAAPRPIPSAPRSNAAAGCTQVPATGTGKAPNETRGKGIFCLAWPAACTRQRRNLKQRFRAVLCSDFKLCYVMFL